MEKYLPLRTMRHRKRITEEKGLVPSPIQAFYEVCSDVPAVDPNAARAGVVWPPSPAGSNHVELYAMARRILRQARRARKT
jgi:hypothetical protein